jgi:hypothetical protein
LYDRIVLTVEPGTQSDLPKCPCCGGKTRVVRGFVYKDDVAHAVYLARWAPSRPKHGATVLVVLGDWSEGSSPADRVAIALDAREHQGGPAFMVVDADKTDFARDAGLGRMAKREEIVGTPYAQEAFDVVDAVAAVDRRVKGWSVVVGK